MGRGRSIYSLPWSHFDMFQIKRAHGASETDGKVLVIDVARRLRCRYRADIRVNRGIRGLDQLHRPAEFFRVNESVDARFGSRVSSQARYKARASATSSRRQYYVMYLHVHILSRRGEKVSRIRQRQ